MENNTQAIAFVRNQLAQSEALLEGLTRDPQGRELPRRDLYQRLEEYKEGFITQRTDPRWIAIAGLRGVGKTTLLAQLYTNTGVEEGRKLCLTRPRQRYWHNAGRYSRCL